MSLIEMLRSHLEPAYRLSHTIQFTDAELRALLSVLSAAQELKGCSCECSISTDTAICNLKAALTTLETP